MVEPTSVECVKVGELRKIYGPHINLRKWLADPSHLYVGRRGRIFIGGEIFHYPGSKWANPFTLKEYSLEEALDLYREHLDSTGLVSQVSELRGLTLGCFCVPSSGGKARCHAEILAELANDTK